ncbi:MAG: LamG domain-containing protein [Gammaproteobacteria bacterium]
MLKNRPFIKLFPVLALVATLIGCDSGGVGTTANPDLSVASGGFVYNGPAARDIDVSNFQYYLYNNLVADTRCGGCHNPQASNPVPNPAFFFFDTSDVNAAYDRAISYVDLNNPPNSGFVDKFMSPNTHFCWETNSDICGVVIQTWIENWQNASNGGVASRQINLVAPDNIRPPGAAKSFPTDPASFATTVYPLLVGTTPFDFIANGNCQNCHEEIATPLPQAPFFASGDVASAYEAAKSKMDIDTPANSRFVQRLNEQHNCWSDCPSDAITMTNVITQFANGIASTPIDEDLVTSMALTLGEGIIASGGSRHETDQFAIWEFKTGSGLTAFDTSGLDPAINLSLNGSVNWVGGYGLEFTGGRAQANPISSDKLYTYILDTGQYAIEAWVIPANVSQQDTNIISYSGGLTTRNFTLGQTLYDYEVFNRVDVNANGEPLLSTADSGDEIAQASLQHVVVNYDPFDVANPGNPGRSIFVNGQRVDAPDTEIPTPINNVWDDTFAFILGSEIGGQRAWTGQVKMVAMHKKALTLAQIQQNFDVGVGQKFFLLFYVGHHLGEDPYNPMSFIMLEVAQYDSYSYLFNNPTFVSLDPNFVPGTIAIKGMRIGINGKEAVAGQAFANLNVTVNPTDYDVDLDQQVLSPLGTIIALEKGPASDEFFLTFEEFNGETNAFTDITPTVPSDPTGPGSPSSDIGVRTFEEINSTISAITGVPVTNNAVRLVYDDYLQQLPTVEAIDAFLPSHQMAIAQLAMTSCSELVDSNPGYFSGFNFSQSARTAFGPLSPGVPDLTQQANRNLIIDPLLAAAMNMDPNTSTNKVTSQPATASMSGLLGSGTPQNLDTGLRVMPYDSLFTTLINTFTPPEGETICTPEDTIPRTAQIVKAICAATTGGAVMLAQ